MKWDFNIYRKIIDDHENLIRTKITIPLDNGDIIKFAFHPQDLPHLSGLQHLVDNPILFEYSQERLSATDLYNGMCGIGDKQIGPFQNNFKESNNRKNRLFFSFAKTGRIIKKASCIKKKYILCVLSILY